MHNLGRILHRGPREILLLGVIVLLPAVALGLLALRTLQGEQVRETYQRRERQQQVLRLLERELSDWILSRRADATDGRFAFEVRHGVIFLPRLNVHLSPGRERETVPRLSGRDVELWRDAQAAEFRGGNIADADQAYRRLLAGRPPVSSWAQLALLRLALRRGDSSGAAFWLKEIRAADPAATTESGIPIRVAAALLLIGHDAAALPSETSGFLNDTLPQLTGGTWPLNAAQWTYYAREIGGAPQADPRLRAEALAAAGFLESLASAAHDVLALDQSLEWRRAQPFVSRDLPSIRSVAVLFPGEGRHAGFVLASDEMGREAEARLIALTAAEDFEGRVAVSGGRTQPHEVSVPAFEFLRASFSERDQTRWRPYLGRYLIFYAAALLLLGAAAALSFTYRAVAREMELSRMKAGFIASVSHEFRTPLSAIEAMLERLESGKVRDEDMLRRYYQASRREVQRLAGMVNQLLDFSRLEEGRGQYRFETIDLNHLAREAIESFVDLGFGARLTDELARATALNLTGDRDAARQCIHNLIDNALKYSPDGSPVRITSGRGDEEIFVRVSDHGPGIAPEEQPLIFEQFYRTGSAGAGGVQGTGIGLALVKTIMAAHGGRVTLDSRPGEGSTFELTFPEART
jgi:signal transduction histidine kinase